MAGFEDTFPVSLDVVSVAPGFDDGVAASVAGCGADFKVRSGVLTAEAEAAGAEVAGEDVDGTLAGLAGTAAV